MCILAIVQFVRMLLQTRSVTRRWQPNRYMNLLVKQGIFYFLVYVLSHPFCTLLPPKLANKPMTNRIIRYSNFLFSLINVLVVLGNLTLGGWQLIVFAVLQYVPMFTLTPRFIMGIRELHARDVQSRRGSWIDTGFGLSSYSRGAGRMGMMFEGAERIEGSEDVGEIPMEVWTTRAAE